MCFYPDVTFSGLWILVSVVSSVVPPRFPLSLALWQRLSAEQCAKSEQRSRRHARSTMGLALGARRSCWGFVLVICSFHLCSEETTWRFPRLLWCGFMCRQRVHVTIRRAVETRRARANAFNALNSTSSSFMSDLKPLSLPAHILHVLLWWSGRLCGTEGFLFTMPERQVAAHSQGFSESFNYLILADTRRKTASDIFWQSLLVCCITIIIIIIMCVSTGESAVMEALGIHLIAYAVWTEMRQYVCCL